MLLNANLKDGEIHGGNGKSQGGEIKGRNRHFCFICKRRTCEKTKKICFRLDKFLKKNVEISFWHGIESCLDRQTFVFIQSQLYGIENKEDIENY